MECLPRRARARPRPCPPGVAVAVAVVLVFLCVCAPCQTHSLPSSSSLRTDTSTTRTTTKRTIPTTERQQRTSTSTSTSSTATYASMTEMRSLLTSRPRLYHHLTSSSRPRRLLRQDQPPQIQQLQQQDDLLSLSSNHKQNHNLPSSSSNLNLNERSSSPASSFSPPVVDEDAPKALVTYGPDVTLSPKGYTLDPCYYHRECQPGFLCIRGDWRSSCSGSSNCFCIADATQIQCGTCLDCARYPNETCVRLPDDDVTSKVNSEPVCVSTYVVFEGFTVEVGCDTFPHRDPISPPPQTVDGVGDSSSSVTGPYGPDNASSSTSPSSQPSSPQQGGGGTQQEEDSNGSSSSPPTSNTSPMPASQSPSTSPTAPLLPNDNSDNTNFNTGDDKNDDTTRSNACIDAAVVVRHVPKHRHVYSQHIRASVLCDAHGSCATAAHMVTWQGQAMTMRQYCALMVDDDYNQGCRRQVMYVNSPRYERRLRLGSNTNGLMFTAFAATFESTLEQATLRVLIHIGL